MWRSRTGVTPSGVGGPVWIEGRTGRPAARRFCGVRSETGHASGGPSKNWADARRGPVKIPDPGIGRAPVFLISLREAGCLAELRAQQIELERERLDPAAEDSGVVGALLEESEGRVQQMQGVAVLLVRHSASGNVERGQRDGCGASSFLRRMSSVAASELPDDL